MYRRKGWMFKAKMYVGYALHAHKVLLFRNNKVASSSMHALTTRTPELRTEIIRSETLTTQCRTEAWAILRPRLQNYKLAAFVRHPLDRYISGLRFQRDKWRKNKGDTVPQMVRRLKTKKWKLHELRHGITPQSWTLQLHPGQELDFIGRFENLTEDWARFCEWAEMPLLELPWHNKGKQSNRHWSKDIPEDMLETVVQHFAEDFRRFGYEPPIPIGAN